MKFSEDEIIWNAEYWFGVSRDSCDEDEIRDILHDEGLRPSLVEQFEDSCWDEDSGGYVRQAADSEDIECIARCICQLVEFHLAGDTPDIGSLHAVINLAALEFEANRT